VPIKIDALSNDQLDNLVQNHRAHGATQEPNYIEALAELGRVLINARRPVKGVERTCPKAAAMSPFGP
jgi:hypothetical protein